MANSSAIKAGRAFVELFADDSKLVSGLKRAKAKLSAFGAGVRESGLKLVGIGTALVAPMLGAAKAFAESGAAMEEMSKRTGISVESLSELSYAAQMSGLSMEDLEKALFKMQKLMGEAATSGKSTNDELSNLGLTFADIKGLNPEQQFKLLADRISRVKDPSERTAAAMSIFGRSGAMLLPMMEKGAAGIDELMQAARNLGLTMSSEDAAAAYDLERAMQTVWMVLKKVYQTIGGALAPVLMDVAGYILDIAIKARDWIKANQELIATVFKVAVGIVAAGAALVGIGTIFTFAAKGIGVLISVISVVHGILGALVPVLVALVSPPGLIAAAFIVLAGLILKATGALDAALQWLADGFRGLVDDCKAAFGAIGNALAKGDLASAAKVLWLTVKLEWVKGISALQTMWADFKMGLKAAFEIAVASVTQIWLDCWYGLRKGWSEFMNWHQRTVETWAGWLAKRMIEVQGLMDDSVNVEQQKGFVDTNVQQNLAAMDQEHAKDKARIDQEQKFANDLAAKQHQDELAKISQERDATVNGLEGDVAKARADWQKALAEANAPDTGGDKRKPLDWLKKGMEGLGDDLDFGKGPKTSAIGTFNASALQGLAGGGLPERTAKATEATAKNTKLLVDNAWMNQERFA